MQDRFKCRVWDKENKCMHYPTRYSNFTIVNGTVVKIESYSIANSAYLGKRIAWEFDDAVIMQSTGLKDKNGKLIYEGDICRNSKSGEIFNVVWHNPLASFCWQKHEHSHIYSYGELFRAFDYYEVIGNIFENKELLNG